MARWFRRHACHACDNSLVWPCYSVRIWYGFPCEHILLFFRISISFNLTCLSKRKILTLMVFTESANSPCWVRIVRYRKVVKSPSLTNFWIGKMDWKDGQSFVRPFLQLGSTLLTWPAFQLAFRTCHRYEKKKLQSTRSQCYMLHGREAEGDHEKWGEREG